MPILTSEKQKSIRFLITRITHFLDACANYLSSTSQIVQVTRIQTTDKGASLRDLYPGAAYHIQVNHHHHHYGYRWHFNNCYVLITIDFLYNAWVFTVSHGHLHHCHDDHHLHHKDHDNVQVFAVSHGLQSEPHRSFQAVTPNPPRNLTIAAVQVIVIIITTFVAIAKDRRLTGVQLISG